jgi:CPA1 family monovalent cation:H+ antiporter
MDAELLALLLCVVALASYVNHKLLRLPPTIGLMAIALAISAASSLAAHFGSFDIAGAVEAIERIDFPDALLHGMLAYLLFAGALHVDMAALRSEAVTVALLASAGVVVTAFAAAAFFWGAARALHVDLPFLYALVFGALIAPTDPVAVMGVMKQAKVAKVFEIHITGESLFNDGVGVALFLAVLGLVAGDAEIGFGGAALLIVKETVGAIVLGFALGWAVYRLLRTVDAYTVEILLTLALAGGAYALAERIGVSAPIAVVVAGVVIGNKGRAKAMSKQTRQNLDTFWALVDQILNGVLFVLIGLEMLVLRIGRVEAAAAALAASAIVAVLLGRAAGVVITAATLRRVLPRWRIAAATWAGLRGGVSVALALSLPESPYRNTIVACTYVVVVFSILVQGLTLAPLLERVMQRGEVIGR